MFWKKKPQIKTEEYKELYHQIELLKIDIAILQKRKQKKVPFEDKDTDDIPEGNTINDGMDELRRLNKQFPP